MASRDDQAHLPAGLGKLQVPESLHAPPVRCSDWLGVSGRIVKALLKLPDSKRGRSLVKHRMAVRAHWNQISLRVNRIANANVSELARVMNMDETDAKLAIHSAEVETAHAASCAEVSDAGTPSGCIPLKGVDGNATHCSLPIALGVLNLIRVDCGRFA